MCRLGNRDRNKANFGLTDQPLQLSQNVTTDQGYWSVDVSDRREIKQIFSMQQKPRNATNQSSTLRVNRHST